MDKPYRRALFIFRRDLRLKDNTGLIYALQHADKVIPCFIFTPQQIQTNAYRSDHCLQFMIESLEDLEKELKAKKAKLYLFFDEPENIIKKLDVDAVIVNQDYTPYSLKRDAKIRACCKQKKIAFHSFEDALLHPVDKTLKKDGKPYTIFTPYFRNASRLEVASPVDNRYANYYNGSIPSSKTKALYKKILPVRFAQMKGGRSAALKILKTLKNYKHYATLRDLPAKDATTHLSAHLKFTTCSVREIYHAIENELGHSSPLLRSLYWRDFFTGIAFHFPHVFSGAFHSKFDRLKWSTDKTLFKKWCEGKTGVPIVDAGMREMNETGFMHNRVRMIVATFLVKDLHINWRWGEKYFAQTLVDYDPAVNNGNWQWVASTGCDAQPYFRIFNPWSQAEKFDPDCAYIKHWVPELSSLPASTIHKWYLQEEPVASYPLPLVDHDKESKATLAAYKKIAKLASK